MLFRRRGLRYGFDVPLVVSMPPAIKVELRLSVFLSSGYPAYNDYDFGSRRWSWFGVSVSGDAPKYMQILWI